MITIETLLTDYNELKSRKSFTSGPSANNRCSTLGHPCFAFCFFDRVVPAEQRAPMDPGLGAIFSEGNSQENILQRDLIDMGYTLREQQGSLYWPKYQISGHRDWAMGKGGPPFVRCEFKSASPFTFASVSDVASLKKHRHFFIKKWYGQILLYMLLDGQEKYWLILKNKVSGELKVIEFAWTDEMWKDAEALTAKAEQINKGVEEYRHGRVAVDLDEHAIIPNSPREPKINDPRICPDCEFFGVCKPKLSFGPGVQMIDNEEMREHLEIRGRTEESATEYDQADKRVKGYFKLLANLKDDGARATFTCGQWIIELECGRRGEKPVIYTEITQLKGGVNAGSKEWEEAKRPADDGGSGNQAA